MTRFHVGFWWPIKYIEEFEKIKKLVGYGEISSLFVNLGIEWLQNQEKILKNNPIGLRYESPDSKHWIDTLREVDIAKVAEDIALCEDQETIGKIFTAAGIIKNAANRRSMELWKMNKVVDFKVD